MEQIGNITGSLDKLENITKQKLTWLETWNKDWTKLGNKRKTFFLICDEMKTILIELEMIWINWWE